MILSRLAVTVSAHDLAGARGLPAGLWRTLTWDQGKELALQQQITAATGAGVFFCDALALAARQQREHTG